MAEEKKSIEVFPVLKRVFLKKGVVTKLLIWLALTSVLACLFPRGESVELNYKIGAVWSEKDLIAPFSFPILRDEREYLQDTLTARRLVFDVFERDTLIGDVEQARVAALFRTIQTGVALRKLGTHRNPADTSGFESLASHLEIPFSDSDWVVIVSLQETGVLSKAAKVVSGIMHDYYRAGVLDRGKGQLTRPEIAVRLGTGETIIPEARVLDNSEVRELFEQLLRERLPDDEQAVDIAYRVGIQHFTPNLHYNSSATEKARAAAIDAVPRTAGFVQENERIVGKHDRITADIKLKLDSLRRAKAERGPEGSTPTQFLGMFLHVAVLIVLYAIYLFLFRKKIFFDNRQLALISILFVFVGGVAYLTRELDINAPIEYLIIVPAASMLLTIVFDSRVGFYGTVIIAILVGGIRGNDYGIMMTSLVPGALAVYTVRDMKNRTQIFRSLGYIFLGYALSILALGMERFETPPLLLEQIGFAFVNAVISPVLTYGLLIFLERVFKVTTDLTLLELAQFNHPLFRMLAVQAPGTYHHSLSMATLAEAAASAVGANEILARVGAYFHDIGKLEKPAYFYENQKGSRNKHDKLSPRMSSLIIGAHVKDGVALAREYGLPEEVIDFIPMHHGTTRMNYFYQKALALARSDPDETKIDEIKESDYRYPGPKPRTKETGILMLADAIEASVRTIEDPTPQRIEDAINELIRIRFEEGELDDPRRPCRRVP
jgi:hypothetical protein